MNIKLRISMTASIIFILAYNLHKILAFAGLYDFLSPISVSGIANILQILFCLIGIILVYRGGLKNAVRELGLMAPLGRALTFSLLATLPMLIGFAVSSDFNWQQSFFNFFILAILSPFAEELLFRGYIFRQLYRRGQIGFWASALIPAVLFAAGHFYQARSLTEIFGIALITGIGSILLCWIFLKWQDNLWVPFTIHALMNLWWLVFAVDETALGGWLANILRLMTVAFAIILTIFKDRIWKPLPTEKFNVENLTDSEKSADKNKFLRTTEIFTV